MKMKVLVTGGAGFIGRWVVDGLLKENIDVWVFDNLSNGMKNNIKEFVNHNNFQEFIQGDIRDLELVDRIFENKFDICIHLAAQINVQTSLDDPDLDFEVNVIGTHNVLRKAKENNTKVEIVSTCMVYDMVKSTGSINEEHPVKPASPYAGSKLAAENLGLSYYYGYGLPVVITRPFNTYGPFQKTNMEGGVVSIFVNRNLSGDILKIFGDGTQTRDLLYVEDCADFIIKAAFSNNSVGEIINAGSGSDININDLAYLICKDKDRIEHIPHHHPQSEIMKLLCDNTKAERLLGWTPKTKLDAGISKLEEWIKRENNG
jgi:nucleoside-diphosphate-sugar epimerase